MPALNNRRVLVVEDDEPTRRMVAAVLSRHAEVDTCAEESDAIALLSAAPYDIVVLALVSQQPDVNAKILRRLAEEPLPPKVILISAGTQSQLDGTESTLVCGRLRKPFAINELIGLIASCSEDPAVSSGRQVGEEAR